MTAFARVLHYAHTSGGSDYDRYEPGKMVVCRRCGGEGRISNEYETREYECPACNGVGYFDDDPSDVSLDDALDLDAELDAADGAAQ